MARLFDQENGFQEVSTDEPVETSEVHHPWSVTNEGTSFRIRVPLSPKEVALDEVVQAVLARRKARAALGAAVMLADLSLPHGSPNGPRYRPQLRHCEAAVQETEDRLRAALQVLEEAL